MNAVVYGKHQINNNTVRRKSNLTDEVKINISREASTYTARVVRRDHYYLQAHTPMYAFVGMSARPLLSAAAATVEEK
jgi:hypothetical protein